jgi:hypothetical protein
LRLQPGLLRLRQVTFGPEIHQRNLHEVVDLILGAGFRRMDGEDGRRLGTFELASTGHGRRMAKISFASLNLFQLW